MSDSKAARILFALAALVYLFLQNWTPQEADAEVGFQATRAVALRGEYYLSPDTPGAVLILRTTEPVHGDAYNCRREENGTRQYPYWGLAYITSGVPFYYIGHFLDLAFPTVNEQFAKQSYCAEGIQGSEHFARILVFSMQPLSAALALVFVMIAARRCGASLFAALAASLCFGFCSNLGVQARSGLSDAMAVATVAWAVERAIAAGKSGRAFDAVTLGIALGIGLLIKVHTVFAVAALPIYLICSRESRWNIYRITAGVTAGMAPFLAIFFIANHVRWGSPFITGYEKSTAHAWFLIDPVQGMNALLFSQSKGVLAYAFPTFTLGMAGLIVLFARRMRALPVILFISICVAMLMPASTIEWHGAWSFGPRYALVAFPQLAVASALAFDALKGKLRLLTIGAGLVGFAIVLPGMFTSAFGSIAVAMDGARARWPDADAIFPKHYDPDAREKERFQRICTLPITDPLNLLRVQHALARKAFVGKDGLEYRADLNINEDGEALPPDYPDFRKFGSIGFVNYRQRFEGSGLPISATFVVEIGIVMLMMSAMKRAMARSEIL